MKQHLILVLAIIGISSGRLYGQTSSDIYLIGTSTRNSFRVTGFDRYTGTARSGDLTPSISFTICSVENEYDILIFHYNYVNHFRAIVDLPISQLSNFNTIDVAQFIATKTKAQAEEWVLANYTKKVWVIDRNDFYKSVPSLPSNDRMKLIEAQISIDGIVNDVQVGIREPR